MRIYYTILVIVLGGCVSLIFHSKRQKISVYSILVLLLLLFQSSLRSIDMTVDSVNDTIRYYNDYKSLLHVDIYSIFKNISNIFSEYSDRATVFIIFMKLSQLISTNFYFFLICVGLIFLIPYLKLIRLYLTTIPDFVVAIVVYEAMFSYFIESGIRQVIAIGLALIAIHYIYSETKYKFFIFLLFAILFHTSAVVLLPIYFLRNISPRKLFVAVLSFVPLLMIFRSRLSLLFMSDSVYSKYFVNSEDNLGTPTYSLMLVLLGVATFLLAKRITADSMLIHQDIIYPKLLFVSMSCALMLMPLTWVDSNLMRLTYYYTLYIPILIPILINTVSRNNQFLKLILRLMIVLIMSLLIIKANR